MTIGEFENTSPGNNYMSFFYYDQGSNIEIEAINVSIDDCNRRNLYDTLTALETITITYNQQDYNAVIQTRTLKNNYYHFRVTPFLLPTDGLIALSTTSCNQTTLLPGPNPIGFMNSNYNATFTNAVNNRTSSNILNVDRVEDQIVPTNYNSIIDGTAEFAQIPDSNYSSIGLTNSRYNGSVTSKQEYGIEPVFGPTLVRAEVYELDKNPLIYASASNSTIVDICSKSLADREFVDILYAPSILDLSGSNQQLATAPDERFIDTAINKVRVYPGWDTTQTTISFHGYGPTQLLTSSFSGYELDLEVGDIFTTRYSLYAERMKVTSVNLEVGPSGGPSPNITASYGVVRNYYGNRDQLALLTGATAYTPVLVTDVIAVRKLVGDTILRADTTKAEKLTDKKLYIEKTNSILYVNDEGRVIWNVHTCI